ncbi:MAG: 8-oxo-dGTP diphosphatase MutT [Gammaproteobacteria bacterium]|nr:8-oxo-dGTP diphosphatase MutT [Gammaproteobacteria bacterium]
MSQKIWVAAGVIENANGEILIAKRLAHLHQGGKWEFPGGKVEANETALQALSRELIEEVNIEINGGISLLKLEHDYGDKIVILDFFHVTDFRGEAKGLEQQEICWVKKSLLKNYQFPAANQPVIEALIKN